MRDAAINFITYTDKNENGNKLEKDVYTKLQDSLELASLRADAMMYYHVYADLVMLSKSNELGKSALDMNTHYLELKLYLSEVSVMWKLFLTQAGMCLSLKKDGMELTKKLITGFIKLCVLLLRPCLVYQRKKRFVLSL